MALLPSIVIEDVPVVAVVFTAVTVAPDKFAVKPALPDTVAVFNALRPAAEANVRTLVPATFNAVAPPKVMFERVELAFAVVTFKVVYLSASSNVPPVRPLTVTAKLVANTVAALLSMIILPEPLATLKVVKALSPIESVV